MQTQVCWKKILAVIYGLQDICFVCRSNPQGACCDYYFMINYFLYRLPWHVIRFIAPSTLCAPKLMRIGLISLFSVNENESAKCENSQMQVYRMHWKYTIASDFDYQSLIRVEIRTETCTNVHSTNVNFNDIPLP